MIRILKPAKAPKILITKGVEQTRKDCADYDKSPDDYRSGAKKFDADSKIYGAKSVKNALLRAQYDKCCYCERKLSASDYGDVEHYRPKGTVKQAPGQDKEYPGYYWLAYEWNNLLVSCKRCNTGHKGILFPLVDNNLRARSHHDDMGNKQPLFINPAIDNPQDHIRFRGGVPISDTEVGRVTIDDLGLRRYDLEEDRRTLLSKLKTFRALVAYGHNSSDPSMQDLVRQAQERLAAATRPEAEYSSMAQDFLGFGA
jgi:uncharacterized protein (TIGR02646 family)